MLTTGELAQLFNVTSQTVINWLEEGRMPYERMGRGPRRVSEQAVMLYIEQNNLSPETLHSARYAALLGVVRPWGVVQNFAAVVVTDADATIIAWNDGATRIFGYAAKEMVGRPIDRLQTRVKGRQGGLEYNMRVPWSGPSLYLKTSQKTALGSDVDCSVTISRLFVGQQSLKKGYLLHFEEVEAVATL